MIIEINYTNSKRKKNKIETNNAKTLSVRYAFICTILCTFFANHSKKENKSLQKFEVTQIIVGASWSK